MDEHMAGCEAAIAIQTFLGSSLFISTTCVMKMIYGVSSLWIDLLILIIATLLIFTLLRTVYKDYAFEIAIRSSFLGIVFALGLYVRINTISDVKLFGTYMCVMAIFHYTEFLVLAIIDPKLVSTSSFVINHSPQYITAAVSSWVEFFVEGYFFPSMKELFWISNVGLMICIAGELLRKTAMINAGTNFNHLVQLEKARDHKLVTTGTYSWFRHPSYVGWFYWSIGTQIILLNPVCIIAYGAASWYFFKQRIYVEEITLLNFFGQQYCDYQAKVGTGIPFIEGYLI